MAVGSITVAALNAWSPFNSRAPACPLPARIRVCAICFRAINNPEDGSTNNPESGTRNPSVWLQQLAKRISYFSVSTLRILSGLHKLDLKTTSREALVEKLGSEQKLKPAAQNYKYKTKSCFAVEEEAKILHGLRNEKRVVIATIADGATGQHSTYRDLWGAFIIHLGGCGGCAHVLSRLLKHGEVKVAALCPNGVN
eukprot:1145059-Pelagomonas_calceolata.AAC.2